MPVNIELIAINCIESIKYNIEADGGITKNGFRRQYTVCFISESLKIRPTAHRNPFLPLSLSICLRLTHGTFTQEAFLHSVCDIC